MRHRALGSGEPRQAEDDIGGLDRELASSVVVGVRDGGQAVGFGSSWPEIVSARSTGNLKPIGPTWRHLDAGVEPGARYDYEVEAFGPGGSAGRFGPVSAVAISPATLALSMWPNPGPVR